MVIFYSASFGKSCERLLRSIEKVVSEEHVKIYWTIEALARRLQQPRNGMNVAIFHISGMDDLQRLISLQDLLWDMKIILILPNSDPDTIAKGHILRPRFLIDYESDFQDVSAVLSRIIGNTDRKKSFKNIYEGDLVK